MITVQYFCELNPELSVHLLYIKGHVGPAHTRSHHADWTLNLAAHHLNNSCALGPLAYRRKDMQCAVCPQSQEEPAGTDRRRTLRQDHAV